MERFPQDLAEGRNEVKSHLTAEHIAEHIAAVGSLDHMDPDQLKRAEIALLVAPATTGLERYLEEFELPAAEGHTLETLASKLEVEISSMILAELGASPHLDLIRQVALARARVVSEDKALVLPDLEANIVVGTGAGVSAFMGCALATAMAGIQAGAVTPADRQELVDFVKQSKQLPLSMIMMPLEWLGDAVHRVYDCYGQLAEGGQDDLLRYDPDRNKVLLSEPVNRWTRKLEGEPVRLDTIGLVEGPTGCPISFDMKLTARLYEHVVELMEHHQAWPPELLPQ